MAEAGNAAQAAANAAERRRRALACTVIGLMVMLLMVNPAMLGSGSSSSRDRQTSTVAGGIPAWLRKSASVQFQVPDAPRRQLEQNLRAAHAVGFEDGALPPGNVTSFFRGVWQTPERGKPLRQVPLANTTLLAAAATNKAGSGGPLFGNSHGDMHMTMAAEHTGVDGLVRLAAAVRIVDGSGKASSSDLFLTPMSGVYLPSTGDVVLVASAGSAAAIVVDMDGACPEKGCNSSQVVAAAIRAGAAASPGPPGASGGPPAGNTTPAGRAAENTQSPSLLQMAGGSAGGAAASLQPGRAANGDPGSPARSLGAPAGASLSASLVPLPPMVTPPRCTVIMRGRAVPSAEVKLRAASASASSAGGRRLADVAAAEQREAGVQNVHPWWWTVGSAIAGRLPPPPRLSGAAAAGSDAASGAASGAASDSASLIQHSAADASRPVPAAATLARPGDPPGTAPGPLASQEQPSHARRTQSRAGRAAGSLFAALRAAARVSDFEQSRSVASAGAPASLAGAAAEPWSGAAGSAHVTAAVGRQLSPRGPAPTAASPRRRLDSAIDEAAAEAEEEEEAAAEAAAAEAAAADTTGGEGGKTSTPQHADPQDPTPADPDAPGMTAFSRSMGFGDDFRAPGSGNVGRYVSRGRGGTRPVVLLIEGVVTSPDCGFAANFTAASVVFDGDAVGFAGSLHSVIMLCLSVLHFGLNIRAILDSLTAQVTATRTSGAAIGLGMAVDAWLCILHGVLPLAVPDLGAGFGVVAVLLLLTFSILEFRLVLAIAKAQRPEAFDDMAGVRGVLSRIYGRFYAVLGLSIAVAVALPSAIPALVFLGCSFWVPQIAHSATIGAPDGMSVSYVAVATAVRAYPVLYLLGCPVNFLAALGLDTYDPAMAVAVGAWLALQLAVMALQRYVGPQFFVPTALLPERYDYHRAVLVSDGRVIKDGEEDAGGAEGDGGAAADAQRTRIGAAWLSVARAVRRVRARARRFPLWRFGPARRRYAALPDVDQDAAADAAAGAAMRGGARGDVRDLEGGGPHDGARLAPDVVSRPRAEGEEGGGDDSDPGRNPDCVVCMTPVELPAAAGSYMVTPCHHLFHDECLRQWLNVKMQCPTCRAPVPAP